MTLRHFRHTDTKRADGTYVKFKRKIEADDTSPLDWMDRDNPDDAKRIKDYDRDLWSFVGIVARASILVVRNGRGTYYHLDSAGLYGIESDSGEEYLNEVYQDQKDELLADLALFGNFTVEN